MTYGRRLTLQLTPLLDLLLIVMFAQYMEVRMVAMQEVDRISNERHSTTAENEDLRRQVDEWEAQQRDINQKQQVEIEQLGQLIRELFRIPEATLNKLIQPRGKSESGGLPPAEIADLKARFQQLANSRGDQVVDHLLTFNEMRKQFDLWELYLNEKGELLIAAGPERQQVKSKVIETPEAFVDAVLQIRRRFPPTKDHVLILCRYGDCRLVNKLSMIRGLPVISERLKSDGQGTTNFDYAVFGYRPLPQIEAR